MSPPDYKNRIEKIAIDLLWSHWIKLGAYVDGRCCQASSDPEVLLLLTVLAAKKDLRLLEVMGQWLHYYDFLVNVERLKTALKLLPEDRYLRDFCTTFKKSLQESLPSQSRKRWGKIFLLLGEKGVVQSKFDIFRSHVTSRKKLHTHDEILEHNPILEFRYAFGVTAKADILYFLSVYINQPNVISRPPASGATIAKALHYDPATVLRALEELKGARLILSGEVSSDTVYSINSHCPLLSWKPKTDRFFLDWFTLLPVFRDILALDDEVLGRHHSIALNCLNDRLKRLDNILVMVPRPVPTPYATDNFMGISQEDLWSRYAKALDEVNDALVQPRRLNWGSDELTRALDTAEHNLWTSYTYLDEFRLLIAIDQIFAELPLNNHQHWFESLFLIRCHSAFRAATRLATSGQLTESFALMRLALENAFYAFHIHSHPEAGEAWIERKNDLKSKKTCKNNFQIKPILEDYRKHNSYNARVARKLYEATIDYGAHPNIDGFTSNLEMKNNENGKTILTRQLNTSEMPLKHAIINLARTGSCCLLIFQNLYPDRFESSSLTEKLRSIVYGL